MKKGTFKHTAEHKAYISARMKEVRAQKKWGVAGDANPAKRPDVRKKIGDANRGRKHTEEAKRKTSETLKRLLAEGKWQPTLPEIPWNKGKKHPKVAGANNVNWSGGKIDALKRLCLLRDDFTCQVCGLRDVDIAEVDHIETKKQRPDLVLVLENLQTLCPNCHRRKTQEQYQGRGQYRLKWRQRYK